MFTVCVDLALRSKYVQFPFICSLQYSININTVEVDPPHSDLLHICIVKPKNRSKYWGIRLPTYNHAFFVTRNVGFCFRG